MNQIASLTSGLALCVCMAMPLSMQAQSDELLPKPHELVHTDCEPFALGRAVQLNDPTDCAYLRRVLTGYG